jgi:hypothetical protein
VVADSAGAGASLAPERGFTLVCEPAQGEDAESQWRRLVGGDKASAPMPRFLDADEVRRDTFQQHRSGIVLAVREFVALQRAGASLLLPQEEEHHVLKDGADPLKSF